MNTVFPAANRMMDRILNISPRLLFWVTLCSVALTAVLLNFSFPAFTNGRQVYNDIVVGEIAIADAYKHGDLLFSFFAVGCFSVFWIVLSLLAVLLRKRPETVSTAVCQDSLRDERLNVWGMLSFSAMLLLVRKNGFWFEPILPLLLLAPYSLLIRKNNASYASRATIAWGASVWGVFFSAAGILALIHFVMPMLMVGRKDSLSVIPVFLAGAWGVIVLALMVKKPAIPRTMALGSQILMPLLLLPFFTRVIEQRGITSGNLFPLYTKIIGLALALGLIAYNIRQFITWRKSDDSGGNCFFIPSVMAFSAFLSFTPLSMNKIDLFHTGELLLAWQQIFEKGQFPYTGFAWARGVSDAVAGFLNVIVFEGNFSTFQYAFNLYGMLISALTAFMLSRRIGTVWGVVLIAIGAQMGSYKWWFFLPPLLLLANPDLLKKPLRWLSAWLVLSLINCLFQATVGIALTLGTFPAAAWIFAVAYREKSLLHAWQQNKKMVLLSSALLALFLLVTAPLMSGFMTYVQEQGTVNELANGTLLNRPTRIPEWFRWKSPLAWGCFRVGGWMVAIAVLWHLLVRCFSTEDAPSRRFTFPTSATVVAISGIFSTIVFIPYSMGRIDSTNLSRTGSIGVFALGLLVPLVIRLSATPSGTARGILCGLLMGCALAPFPIYPGILARQAMDVSEAPSSTVWFDGEANGLPKMGKTYIDSDQLAMLLLFKQVTDNVLKPHETYYDLTNNLAFYYFLDKKVSSLYAGYYIVTSETIQNKVISCLERTPPPLVWVGPARELGSGGASMRSYRVYRWLMLQGYVPLYHNGLAFLVRPDRYRELTGGDQPLQRKVIELTSFLAPADIQGVSAAWGSSFDGLTSRFSDVTSSTRSTITSGTRFFSSLDGGVPAVTENVVFGVPVDGAQADFLLVRLSAMGNNEKIPIMVRWRGVTGREEVMECQGHPGRSLLLPLGSHPAWLLSPRIANVSIDVAGWWPVPPLTSLKLLKLRR